MKSKINDTPAPNINSYNITIKSEEGTDYNLNIELQKDSIIFALTSNTLPSAIYQKEYSFDELNKIKYFSAFYDNINDIFIDICDFIKQKLLKINEGKASLFLSIDLPMKKIGQLNFEIPEKEKDQSIINKELIREVNNLQKKVEMLERKISFFNIFTTSEDLKVVQDLIGKKN